ncbi:hypothetical protein [Paraburkholderia metrosideri]|uniref:hypothetical protein n=1 Tax=Paraburkholderia metrosideri TaxID=580937 RepID=UPI0038BA262D
MSPTLMGWAKSATGSFMSGLYLMAVLLVSGAIAVLAGTSKAILHEVPTDTLLQSSAKN